MGSGEKVGAARYAAFISYSHKDAGFGRWLHRRLEGYRLPRRLAGSEGEQGPVPARLTPIFRDREELPAAGDLSERVREALAMSATLIVVCSRHAAASPWVAKEIATFRALHPGRAVLAAIVDGEPAQCFPAALTAGGPAEPLAADFRAGRDGKRLGLLKLVAGLAGVGLDALVQRDAQRRVRRVTWVTGAALAAVVAMAVLTAFAFSERREAERQRAQAEGLVEFMLTDLREKLQGVGRLDVMQAVNGRALRYYRDRKIDAGPAGSRLRRARLLRLLADDFISTGDLARAANASEQAHLITADVLRSAPSDPQRRLEHARSEYALGRIHEVRGEWPAARKQYSVAAETVRLLLREKPDNPDYLVEAGGSAIGLGNAAMYGAGDIKAAEAAYLSAVSSFEQALAHRPGDAGLIHDLANAHAWLADRYYVRQDWPKSAGERLRQFELLRGVLAKEPENMETYFRFALAERALGRAYAKTGNAASAERLTADAYRSSLALTRHDPRNADWLLFRTFMACDLLFGKIARPSDASRANLRADIRRASSILERQNNPRRSGIDGCVTALATDRRTR